MAEVAGGDAEHGVHVVRREGDVVDLDVFEVRGVGAPRTGRGDGSADHRRQIASSQADDRASSMACACDITILVLSRLAGKPLSTVRTVVQEHH